MAVKRNPRLLLCKAEICEYLGNVTDYMFRKHVKQGLPALYDGRGWLAHADNIDEWFKTITRVQVKGGIDNIPEEEKTID